ncbi:MAG: hypothetical protein ABIO96_09205 [Nitrospiraceae bacterium]
MSNLQGGAWGHAESRGRSSGGSGTRQGDARADGLTASTVMLMGVEIERIA